MWLIINIQSGVAVITKRTAIRTLNVHHTIAIWVAVQYVQLIIKRNYTGAGTGINVSFPRK